MAFISYYKAGACGEHSALAYFLANESDMTVRKVGDPSGYHVWLEVLSDGEWYFYDPTFNISQYEVSDWFNKRSFRWNNSVIRNAARIFYEKEDITHYYPPYGSVNITGIAFTDSVYIKWGAGNPKYSYRLNTSDVNTISINLTPKQYSLHLNRLFCLNKEVDLIIRPEGYH